MQEQTFTMSVSTELKLHVYQWLPEPKSPIIGSVLIAHGMCETAERYMRLAEQLTQDGYAVYAHDQRGHGLTAGELSKLGDTGKDGFNGMVKDILQLGEQIRQKHPDAPCFLMGHSMGSFIVQKIIIQHGTHFSGYILSGSNGPRGLLRMGKVVASLSMKLQGEKHRSILLNALTFGSFNKRISPVRTPFDWLSRDDEEVDKYINDPYCGAVCTTQFFRDFFSLLQEIQDPRQVRQVPANLPVYIFAGDQDPVGNYGKGIKQLAEIYRKQGLQDVNYKLYPGGRHEMLNEINREEVARDILNWLKQHTNTQA